MKKEDFLNICRSKSKTTLTEQEESFLGSIGESIEKALNEESVERNKQLNAIETKLGTLDEGTTFSGVIRELATTIDNVEAKATRTMSNSDKYNLKKLLEGKKDELQKATRSGNHWEIEFKAKRTAAAMMTSDGLVTGATAYNHDNLFDDMEVVVIQYPKSFVLDSITSKQVSKVPKNIRQKEQDEMLGAAAVTAAGVSKPMVEYSFVWKSYDRKKYAGHIEFEDEVEIDFEQLLLQIVTMFETEVLKKWQAGLIADIIAWCSTYTTTSLDGTMINPDIFGVIMAGCSWIEGYDYSPDVLWMHPQDLWLAKGAQDINGAYKFNPFGTGFAGLQLFTSTGVTAGTVVIGTKSTVKEQHGSYILRKGVIGDQFIHNESTIVGEIYSILQLPTANKNSWVKLDIETVLDALNQIQA